MFPVDGSQTFTSSIGQMYLYNQNDQSKMCAPFHVFEALASGIVVFHDYGLFQKSQHNWCIEFLC